MSDSLSPDEALFVVDGLRINSRLDGRAFQEYRHIDAQLGCVQDADGSAIVRLGDTTAVLVTANLSLCSPSSIAPDAGRISVNTRLSPSAMAAELASGGSFSAIRGRGAPARALSRFLLNLLLHTIPSDDTLPVVSSTRTDQAVSEGVADVAGDGAPQAPGGDVASAATSAAASGWRQLCIVPSKKAFMLTVDVNVLAHGGGAVDAAALAVRLAVGSVVVPRMRVVLSPAGDVRECSVDPDADGVPVDVTHVPLAATVAMVGATHASPGAGGPELSAAPAAAAPGRKGGASASVSSSCASAGWCNGLVDPTVAETSSADSVVVVGIRSSGEVTSVSLGPAGRAAAAAAALHASVSSAGPFAGGEVGGPASVPTAVLVSAVTAAAAAAGHLFSVSDAIEREAHADPGANE